MIKEIFNIIKIPYSVAARLNRTKFINQAMFNVILAALFLIFGTKILPLYYSYAGIDISNSKNIAFYFYIIYNSLLVLYFMLFIVTIFRLNNARLHDMNSSGLWNLTMFIPLLNIIFNLTLQLASGTKGPNKFGDQPAPESKAKIILAILNFFIIPILAILTALFK